MTTFSYIITDPVGLHARPAVNLSRFAARLTSAVRVAKAGAEGDADAKSMLNIMTLGIRTGDVAEFALEGPNEAEEAEKLRAFCEETL